jgi:hypothetical protein
MLKVDGTGMTLNANGGCFGREKKDAVQGEEVQRETWCFVKCFEKL